MIFLFIGTVSCFGEPLHVAQLLWINVLQDTFGALALVAEAPSMGVMSRKPYKRTASLISVPIRRNIISQVLFQTVLMTVLIFFGPQMFNIKPGDWCQKYRMRPTYPTWKAGGGAVLEPSYGFYEYGGGVSCPSFMEYCPNLDGECFEALRLSTEGLTFSFSELEGFKDNCLECVSSDRTHITIMFNTFVFCQLFNLFNSRMLNENASIFSTLFDNPAFLVISVVVIGLQYTFVQHAGEFMRTSSLTVNQWGCSVTLGAISLLIGIVLFYSITS
jgi:magnesium-transporting ATPase (P-type)